MLPARRPSGARVVASEPGMQSGWTNACVAVARMEARTPRMEPARRRGVDGIRDVALEHDARALPAALRIRDRHRRQQRAGVRVLRLRVELVARRDLHRVAEVHDHDAVRDVADDVQVVRDEDVGQSERSLQVLEQVDDLRLHGDVERRDRLIAHDQLRIDRECTRDPDALALAAGELVREAVVVLRG